MNQLDDGESTWGMLFLMFVLHGDGIFMENTPLRTWKSTPGSLESPFGNHDFKVACYINFGGVVIFMERKEATDTSRGNFVIASQLHWRTNSSSTLFSLEDEMVSTPQKRDTIREIECLDIFFCKNSDMEPENAPSRGKGKTSTNPSIWRFQPLNFCGVYSMRRSHLNFLRGLSANGNEEMQARTAEKWVP